MVEIRKAIASDCKEMLALIKELAIFEKEPTAVVVTEDQMAEWGFGTNPLYWAFVAEENLDGKNTIVGLALCYTRYSTWKGPRCYLEDIIVTEKYRSKGIGSQLFKAVRDDAQQKGFSGMIWQVLEWNEPAINFYKKLNANFDAEWVNVSIEL
jgi:ribosomal protein S18 acetylase RimI-like enzyme